jgi:transcriptional regulator with XRE-family HTH domain
MFLSQWLKEKGITRKNFAARIGVSPPYITALCDGSVWPGRNVMNRIIAETNNEVSPESFLQRSVSIKDATKEAADQITPEALSALRERARMSGRSLETEIAAILTQAARAGRGDLATWSAGLRSRLRNRYAGDVTADIRSDRRR